jgi:hypothetical protein
MRKRKMAVKMAVKLAQIKRLEEETLKDLTLNAAADGSINNNGAIEATAPTVNINGEPDVYGNLDKGLKNV